MLFTIINIIIIILINQLVPILPTDSKNDKISKSVIVIALVMAIQVFVFGFKTINLLYTLVLVYAVSLAKGGEVHKIFSRDLENFKLNRKIKDNTERVYDLTQFYPDIYSFKNNKYKNATEYTNSENQMIKCQLDQDFWTGKHVDPIRYCRKKLYNQKTWWEKIKDFFGF